MATSRNSPPSNRNSPPSNPGPLPAAARPDSVDPRFDSRPGSKAAAQAKPVDRTAKAANADAGDEAATSKPGPRKRGAAPARDSSAPMRQNAGPTHEDAAPVRQDAAPMRQDLSGEVPEAERLSDQERQRRIAEAAYRKAQERGFSGDRQLDDWLEAEREHDGGANRQP